MTYTISILNHTEEDSFEEGALPETSDTMMGDDIVLEGREHILNALARYVGLDIETFKVVSTINDENPSRIDTQYHSYGEEGDDKVFVDTSVDNGDPLIKLWKKGEINLTIENTSFYVTESVSHDVNDLL